ncbi:hypothetical protein MAR_016939 [Mya arenaria]|uniref:Uncharacterized protein n=1 Tax=Mya arenaria TaxID=6604 RepID=A0ABY7EDP0_MYAAR|nr:uncharacterized protein LOC128237138 isoform X2 [Mya arenaria]WAR06981.1 hypothetical protein MAR_016939 [Mya arenaria]
MAHTAWILFGILVAVCNAQFGFNRNEQYMNRRPYTPLRNQTPRVQVNRQSNRPPSPFGIKSEEKQCYTTARRSFFMTRMVHYPCNRRMPGVPVVRSFMGPMGPVCMSYIREPVYRYFKVPVCCPGLAVNAEGRCVSSLQMNQTPRNSKPQMQRPNNNNMMSMAARMREAMWVRAQKDMARRRAAMHMAMRNKTMQRRREMAPPMPPRRPHMAPLMHMYHFNQMMNQRNFERQRPQQPRITFLRFNRSSTPPMPHPVQQPPLSGRFINIIRNRFNPTSPFPFVTRPSLPAPPMYNMIRPPRPNSMMARIIPRVVLSARMLPITNLRQFTADPEQTQPKEAATRVVPQETQYQDVGAQTDGFQQDQFPQIPEPRQESQENGLQVDGFGKEYNQMDQFAHEDGFHGFQEPAESMMQVDLPQKPVEMPDLIVEQAPASMGEQESCIVQLETAVKTCLKTNNIDVPDVMSAFEPFNEDKSRVLCQAEDAIFKCISDTLNQCSVEYDAAVARDMLLETAQTVKSMCELRAVSVQVQEPTADVSSATQIGDVDTSATVENVDAIPTEAKPATSPEKNLAASPEKNDITIIEEAPRQAAPSVESFKTAIEHEVHVQEMLMREHLLPILLGAGVGFIVLVLFVSLIICCCCKRRLHKKMRIIKELEKPPLKDGIYTIGVSPPHYEVNGIPPMYYEEAKGEIFTSASPSVVEGSDLADEAAGNNTQM